MQPDQAQARPELTTRAVIFDLFGTLIDLWPEDEHRALSVSIAETLGVPVADFLRLHQETYIGRSSGAYESIEANYAHICEQLGIPVSPERLAAAARLRVDFQRGGMAPREDAVPTILALRERGYAIGLISDCAPDVPLLWPETAFAPLFDATVFSCVAGTMKPDPRLYAEVTAALGVAPANCTYVGDNIHELEGATRAGMTPYRILAPAQAHHYHDRDAWPGNHLSTLDELLALLP